MAATCKIAAVLVLYNQQIETTETYRTLLQKSEFPCLIYDNSKTAQLLPKHRHFSHIHDPSNPGVSAAYNRALDWALAQSASHLLLLDSDSSFPENAIEEYRKAADDFPDKIILPSLYSHQKKISPFYFTWGKSTYGDSITEGAISFGKILAINSGALLPLSQIGAQRFNEKLPLDWSDIYFFRKMGAQNISAQHIELKVTHNLSEHELRPIETAKFRFKTYLAGVSIVSNGFLEKWTMLFWAKMKALKLSFQYKSSWFFLYYLKNFNG